MFFFVLACLLSALALLLCAQPLIHIFQLESYKRPQFFLRLREDASPNQRRLKALLISLGVQTLLLALFFIVLPLAFQLTYDTTYRLSILLLAAVYAAAMAWLYFKWKEQPSKKPLKATARVVRLDAALGLVAAVLHALVFFAFVALLLLLLLLPGIKAQAADPSSDVYFTFSFLMLLAPYLSMMIAQFLLTALLPRFLAFASILAQPVENAVKRRYFNEAKAKLEGFSGMVKVGITGSYGKTSCKVILATILAEKYHTYATPHSYNTPMGVTKAVREQLDSSYEVFVAEMGARHPGDISEMCRLVQPKYGLLTSVGPQHLETFGSIEAIAKTKYELIEALPPFGVAFFPSDNELCLELWRKTEKQKVLFGLDGHGEQLDMTARDLSSGPEGSSFTLACADGETAPCTTKLLGRHNVQNILGCAAVARALGLTLDEIASGISKIQPVEHRLQLIPTANGLTVIDDAFNSNPAGCRAALEVLKSFPGRKVIVTPGLVELGDAEYAENEAFGRAMAGSVDVAILVARNAEAMKKGLLEAGFDERNLIVTGKLAEATVELGKIGRAGDVVLFENDLPDHYET